MSDTLSQNSLATVRHDLRNAMATAMLSAELLCAHDDLSVRHRAQTIIDALENALASLKNLTIPSR